LQGQAVDMVLTDYSMPDMTGYELLKAIKVRTHADMQQTTAFSELRRSSSHTANFTGVFQAMNLLKPIPVVVMSSENEPQRISR
jgi:two-component response regulator ARR-A family